MDKNKGSAVDDFLNSDVVRGDNENLVEPEPNPLADMHLEVKDDVNSQQNSADNNGEDKGTKEGEDKPLPFHQNPKVKRYIEKEVARLTQNMSPRQSEEIREQVAKDPDVVSAFAAIIGNDTPEKVNALTMLRDTLKGFEEKATSATRMREAEITAERQAREQLEQGFENIEDEFDTDLTSNTPVARKNRGEFIEFIKRIAPKNANGEITEYPDFRETYTLFTELKAKPKPQTNRAKELAARSVERSSDASNPAIPTDTSWRGVEKFISTLKG